MKLQQFSSKTEQPMQNTSTIWKASRLSVTSFVLPAPLLMIWAAVVIQTLHVLGLAYGRLESAWLGSQTIFNEARIGSCCLGFPRILKPSTFFLYPVGIYQRITPLRLLDMSAWHVPCSQITTSRHLLLLTGSNSLFLPQFGCSRFVCPEEVLVRIEAARSAASKF